MADTTDKLDSVAVGAKVYQIGGSGGTPEDVAELKEQVSTNQENIVANQENIATNQENIKANQKNIATNSNKINELQNQAIVINNTLTSTSTTEALSAAQGKVLNDRISAINDDMENLGGGGGNVSINLNGTEEVGEVVPINADSLGGVPAEDYLTKLSLMWENADITSSFASQYANGTFDKTKPIFVVYKYQAGANVPCFVEMIMPDILHCPYRGYKSVSIWREVRFESQNSRVAFGNAFYSTFISPNENGTTNNAFLVPYQIYQ